MKKISAIGGIILITMAIAAYGLANGPGRWSGRHMMGDWGWNSGCYIEDEKLTDEQRSQIDKLYQEFDDKTAQLRNEIWTKTSELDALLDSSEPDAEKAKALQSEISELKAQVAQEQINYNLEARKIAPEVHYGWDGHHRGGYGRHMGDRGLRCWD